jgi:hypothetical protein
MSEITWTLTNNLDMIAGAIRNASYEVTRRTMDEMLQGVRASMRATHTGRIYGAHQASAAGEAPAVESGELIASLDVDVTVQGSQVVGIIFSDDPKAIDLEYGTHNMSPRPFLTPAGEQARRYLSGYLEAELRKRVAA